MGKMKLKEFIASKQLELKEQYDNVKLHSHQSVTLANGKVGLSQKVKRTSLNKTGIEAVPEQFPPGSTTAKENGTLVVFHMHKQSDFDTTLTKQYFFLWK